MKMEVEIKSLDMRDWTVYVDAITDAILEVDDNAMLTIKMK